MLAIILAFLARAAGGGLGVDKLPQWCNRLPELLFAVPFGVVAYSATGSLGWGIFSWVWSFVAMELGHGNVYRMGGIDGLYIDRPQSIEKIVRPIYSRLGGQLNHPRYSWAVMGTKGFLIGLPAFPCGLGLVVLWPLAYHIGHRIEKQPSTAEWISGMFAGFTITSALALHEMLAEQLGGGTAPSLFLAWGM